MTFGCHCSSNNLNFWPKLIASYLIVSSPTPTAIKGRSLFDDLVGDRENAGRNSEAECLGSLKVHDQLELGRLCDRQVGRLFTLENTPDVNAGHVIGFGPARSIAFETASRHELASLIDRRHALPCRQSHELFGTTIKKLAGSDDERVCPQLGQSCKRRTDFSFCAGIQDMDLQTERACRLLHVPCLVFVLGSPGFT